MTAQTRPLIGLTTYREDAAWGVWRQRADVLPAAYAEVVRAAGGHPLLLPPMAPEDAVPLSVRLDGLLVCGGADLDPATYGETAHPRTGAPRADRDSWELALLHASALTDLPTLGICRGMQALAVHAGGRLVQHLPDVVGHEQHSPGGDAYGTVAVRTAPESRLRELVGDTVEVACHHHQAVSSHPGFRATAHAADGTVEGIEHETARFRLGVQWHPEVTAADPATRRLVEALVSAASVRV